MPQIVFMTFPSFAKNFIIHVCDLMQKSFQLVDQLKKKSVRA